MHTCASETQERSMYGSILHLAQSRQLGRLCAIGHPLKPVGLPFPVGELVAVRSSRDTGGLIHPPLRLKVDHINAGAGGRG
ncbi:hypothetical protein AOLI_G00281910 [Acnodon oligacanthus]